MNRARSTGKKQRRSNRGLLGTVRSNWRAHVAFLLALFILQTLYTVLFFSAATDLRVTTREVTDTYDYELAYRGMTQPQYVHLYNACGTAPIAAPETAPYVSVRYEEMADGSYNAYIKLKGVSLAAAARSFVAEYGIGELKVDYSPLYDYRTEYLPDIFVFLVLSTLAVFALALFLLMQLYRMRLDRDTFDYGIYMTCGATYHRLYWHSCRELAALAALTTIPALAAGCAIAATLYASRGVTLYISLVPLMFVLLFTLLTIHAAVHIPMRRLSRRPPVELLRARDNSNHVISPRRSRRIFGAAFPRDLELLSLWRYRRYFAVLMLSAVLLPVLFTSTLTLADIYEKRQASPAPDFTVTFTPEVVNPEELNENTAKLAETISALDGVSMCLPERLLCPATSQSGHMLLKQENTAAAASATVYFNRAINRDDADQYTAATNFYSYMALDEAAIAALKQQYTGIEGDLFSVLGDDHTVVITESVNNTHMFDFSVGDKILVATTAENVAVEGILDLKQVLLQQLDSGIFGYEEYTVGAVIHDVTDSDHLLLGLNFDAYAALNAEVPVRYSLDVYLESDADFAAWERVSNGVYAAAYRYYNCGVTDHDLFFDRYTASLGNLEGRLRLLAASFLAMMPLILFFSQRVFYKKREKEWDMLRALGASSRDILQSNLIAGLATAAAALILTVPCVLVADRVMFSLFNRYLPAGGFISSVVLHYAFPWSALAVAAALSLLCGFLPPLIAGLRYRARCKKRIVSLMAGE